MAAGPRTYPKLSFNTRLLIVNLEDHCHPIMDGIDIPLYCNNTLPSIAHAIELASTARHSQKGQQFSQYKVDKDWFLGYPEPKDGWILTANATRG